MEQNHNSRKNQMVEISKIYNDLKNKEEKNIIAVFGKPSFKGQNSFG